ncbi:GIY-YIG nuclease family protein [Undibacterium terreum]|uniref:Bacteriophage T5 Orf172 DNA-binding domain-containing protein n=1 Tax=Undibacterium terreum TaxID=1224302 RepID=A0A916XKG2_9BURK|nr:GIY-YIG nuclease family protein [Undibacterium terreum]GGC81040.1 hypothetical protein GCM10011396_30310 [Undibacterium terreum]
MTTPSYRGNYREHRANHGVPGIVYLLANQGLREGVYKIGSTRRSGWSKAMELNRDINNTIPGTFVCEFEVHTRDCGGALEQIFQELQYCHRGRKEQDYFELELDRAKEIIGRICAGVDEDILHRHRARLDQIKNHDLQGDIELAGEEHDADETTHTGVFKKAYLWMTAAVSMLALVAIAWVFSAWTDGNHLYASNAVARPAYAGDASAAVQNGFTGGEDANAVSFRVVASPQGDGSVLPVVVPTTLPAGRTPVHDKYATILAKLNEQEKSAVGMACISANDKNSSGKITSNTFSSCVMKQLAAFDPAKRPADMSALNQDEKSSVEYACLGERYGKGLAAYNSCLSKQVSGFDPASRPEGMSRLSLPRQRSMQAACAQDKYQNGPRAYNQCLSRQLAQAAAVG